MYVHTIKKVPQKSQATLYAIVYGSPYVKAGVLVMLSFLVTQLVSPAFAAAAEEVSNTDVAPQIEQKPESSAVEMNVAIEEPFEEKESVDKEEFISSSEIEPAEGVEKSVESSPDIILETVVVEEILVDTGLSEDSASLATLELPTEASTTSQQLIESDHASSTIPEISPEPEVIETPSIEAPQEIDDIIPEVVEILETEATTSPEVMEAHAVQFNDLNRYQFGEQECVSVGDGAFYCTKAEVESSSSIKTDGVYSEPDEGGDAEIFMRKNGIVKKITDNNYDDLSPYYDAYSDSIVWHQLKQGRYEIMSYDIKTQTESQVTFNTTNDMEAVRFGEYTVFQRWLGDNWEIILSKNGEEKQLSHSANHDLAPSIRDGYVIWHTRVKGEPNMLSVYELETGYTSTISDPDGGHVANPRFVLVYDTSFDNGDVITKEYDPKTGEVRPVGSVPAPIVPNIPSSDATGETRALIGSKTTMREESLTEGESPTVSSSTPQSSGIHASSTSVATIGEDAIPVLDLASSSAPLPLDDFDIIVDPFEVVGVDSTSTSSEAGT